MLFDAGIKYKRYCSDMTRTAAVCKDMHFGKEQKFKNRLHSKIYEIVLKAQEKTISKARSGMSGKDIDAIARNEIEKSGYGKYFVLHSKIYEIVLKAQEKTISKARSGMSGKDIDAIARNEIEKSGYGKYFVHSTGHGVGLDIHELPRISRLSEDRIDRIEDNMVFSIEPGIYLPNEFGVRIEDVVVMRNGRAEIL